MPAQNTVKILGVFMIFLFFPTEKIIEMSVNFNEAI